jgi:multidrug efflux pump subunit AcrB
VLAIGIVVDDAIVVVENVERHIEHGLSPRDATYKAMEEVSGPIIAIALVLGAVFIPTAFVSGLTGQFYRQFALTIAISTVISAFNSLTLSPALASRLLRPRGAARDPRPADGGPCLRAVLRRVQPVLQPRRRRRTGRRRPLLRVSAAVVLRVRRPAGADGVRVLEGAEGFVRRRTRTTWSPSRSCRTRPRSIAPTR